MMYPRFFPEWRDLSLSKTQWSNNLVWCNVLLCVGLAITPRGMGFSALYNYSKVLYIVEDDLSQTE